MSYVRCPICRELFDPTLSNAKPFCSERCRQIDLGRWLREEYGMPWEPEDQAEFPERYDREPGED